MSAQPNNIRGRKSVDVTANKILTAADCGIIQNVTVDGVVITVPATAAGMNFAFRNGGHPTGPAGAVADGTVGFQVSPQAADGVTGNGFTAAVNKDVICAKTTSKVGDEFTLRGSGVTGATAYYFDSANLVGTYTREA